MSGTCCKCQSNLIVSNVVRYCTYVGSFNSIDRNLYEPDCHFTFMKWIKKLQIIFYKLCLINNGFMHCPIVLANLIDLSILATL